MKAVRETAAELLRVTARRCPPADTAAVVREAHRRPYLSLPGMSRPDAAGYFHRLFEQPCQQRLQLFLYGIACVPLLLPAAVPAAVIAEREFEILHCPRLRASVYTISILHARHIC